MALMGREKYKEAKEELMIRNTPHHLSNMECFDIRLPVELCYWCLLWGTRMNSEVMGLFSLFQFRQTLQKWLNGASQGGCPSWSPDFYPFGTFSVTEDKNEGRTIYKQAATEDSCSKEPDKSQGRNLMYLVISEGFRLQAVKTIFRIILVCPINFGILKMRDLALSKNGVNKLSH